MKSATYEALGLEPNENRIWPRVPCNIETNCGSLAGDFPCRIVDISQFGFGIISAGKLSPDELLNFSDPPVMAKVVWTTGNRAGLKIIN